MRFTDEQREVVRFCAVECEMQRSGEASVGWMVNAWQYALVNARTSGKAKPPNIGDILNLGSIVEPEKNKGGFRQVAVRIGWDVLDAWRVIPHQMEDLCAATDTLAADEWFYEYEKVHPFVDGNGRTGQILFNWLGGTLDAPKWAPNFFDDPRRVSNRGAPFAEVSQ